MKYSKEHTKFKVKAVEQDPFTDAQLDRVFDDEYQQQYDGEKRVQGKIHHLGAMHYAAEIFTVEKNRKDEKKSRIAELGKVREEIQILKGLKNPEQVYT